MAVAPLIFALERFGWQQKRAEYVCFLMIPTHTGEVRKVAHIEAVCAARLLFHRQN